MSLAFGSLNSGKSLRCSNQKNFADPAAARLIPGKCQAGVQAVGAPDGLSAPGSVPEWKVGDAAPFASVWEVQTPAAHPAREIQQEQHRLEAQTVEN